MPEPILLHATRPRSIPGRLALFAAALAIPILVFVGIILWQFAIRERARVEGDALDTARGVAVAIDRELTGLLASLDVLALAPALQRGDLAAFRDQAAELMARRGLITVLRTPDGQQVVNLRRPAGEDLPRTPFAVDAFVRERRMPAVSGVFTGALAQQPLFAIVVPVTRQGTSDVLYLLSFSIPVDRIRQIILDEKPPESWTVSVIDQSDHIIARNARHDEFVGKLTTPDLREQTRTGNDGKWNGRTLDGHDVLGSFARVQRADWRVAIGVRHAELNAPLYASLRWFAALGALLAVLATLLALAFARRITRPMRALAAQAAALGREEAVGPMRGTLVEVERVSAALAATSERLRSRSAERDAATEALREETQRLEALSRVAMTLAGELDPERLAAAVTEAAVRLSGATRGVLLQPSGTAPSGWAATGAAGSGADDPFGTPWTAPRLRAAFEGAGIVRSGDVTEPGEDTTLRSLMALPLFARSGQRLAVLVVGHAAADRFGEREQRMLAGIAGQAAAAIDNAQLFASVQHGRERFGAAVQAVRGVLWTNDAEGRMSGPQPGWSALTGQTTEECAGYGWADAVHPEDRDASVASWQEAVAGRRTFLHEHRVRRHDGLWRTFAIRAIPVLDAEGAIREWVGVHTDITEQRAAEAELRESNEEIQRYAYIVSHDLRAPLVNVMGFTSEIEAIQEEIRTALAGSAAASRIDADLTESIGFIKAAIVKMEGLIAAILKLSREGRRTFRAEPLAMRALVQGLADAQRHQADAANATVEIGDLPDITADRLAVEQIFGNLIDNAIKYLDRSRPGRITITGERAGPWIRFAVADNGRGIAEADHVRVFELFRRAGTQDRPGDGIGLAHVRTLVRALGGRIELASQPGAGTTFAVTLPAVAFMPRMAA